MELIKLVALDADDLAVISAHVQDAVVRVGDIAAESGRGLALALRRFDWQAAERDPQRRLAALEFGRVTAVKAKGVAPDRPDDVLNLLAITWDERDAPSGCVTLVFSGDVALRLDVECIEARLTDLGPAWSAKGRPAHAVDEGTPATPAAPLELERSRRGSAAA